MGEIKQMNIKNRNYYFYNDVINLDGFGESKINVDRKNFNDIDIYYLGYNWSLIKNNDFCIEFNTRKKTKIW